MSSSVSRRIEVKKIQNQFDEHVITSLSEKMINHRYMQEKNRHTLQSTTLPQLALAHTAPLEQQGFASLHKERYWMLNKLDLKEKRNIRDSIKRHHCGVCEQVKRLSL